MSRKVAIISKEDGEVRLGRVDMIQNSLFNSNIASFGFMDERYVFGTALDKENIRNFILDRGQIFQTPDWLAGHSLFIRTDGIDQVFIYYTGGEK